MTVDCLRCVGRVVLCLIALVALISCSDDPTSSEPLVYSQIQPEVIRIDLAPSGDTGNHVDAPFENTLLFDLRSALVTGLSPVQHLRISHHTRDDYVWFNCSIVMDVYTGHGTITCKLRGIDYPTVTQDALGPARQTSYFRMEPGTYLLRYVLGDAIDRYKVTIDDRYIEVEPINSSFTSPGVIHSEPIQ